MLISTQENSAVLYTDERESGWFPPLPFSPPNFQSIFFVMRTSVGGKKHWVDLRCKGTLYLKDHGDMVRLGNTGKGKNDRHKEWWDLGDSFPWNMLIHILVAK